MSFEYTTSLVYGFRLRLTVEHLQKLHALLSLPFTVDEEYYKKAPAEYLRESTYELLEKPVEGVTLDLYTTEGSSQSGRWLIIQEPGAGWNISKQSWEDLEPSPLPAFTPSDRLQELAAAFGETPSWLFYTTVY